MTRAVLAGKYWQAALHIFSYHGILEEQDQARQRRQEEINAAALAAAEDVIKARQREIEEEVTLVAEHWL